MRRDKFQSNQKRTHCPKKSISIHTRRSNSPNKSSGIGGGTGDSGPGIQRNDKRKSNQYVTKHNGTKR